MKIFASLALAVCLAGVAAAELPTKPTPVVISVPYHDLNLANASGVARLVDRMESAMESVCGKRPHPREVTRQVAYEACKGSLATEATLPTVRRAFDAALARLG